MLDRTAAREVATPHPKLHEILSEPSALDFGISVKWRSFPEFQVITWITC